MLILTGMNYRNLIISTLTLISLTLSGQVNKTGAPIVSYFDVTETPGDIQNWCIAMDNRGVMFFGTQNKGILTYDGTQWGVILMNDRQRVNALATDPRGIVYAGGETDFGMLQPDDRGDLKFVSLADRISDSIARREVKMIFSIAADNENIYFTDRRKLYIYNFNADALSVVDMNRDFGIRNAGRLLLKDGRLIIADNRDGLFELRNNSIVKLPGGDNEMIRMTLFMSLLSYDPEQILISTYNNGLFLYNLRTGVVRNDFLQEKHNEMLKGDLISDAIIVPGNRIAISVFSGEGIYIFDHNGILLQQISSETTGLPESTVTAMYCDHMSNAQLWFCTMGYINRAYISLPISEFGSGSGILTTLGDIKEFNGSLYVSYDFGLYKSYVDEGGRVQFGKLEGLDAQAFELLNTEINGKRTLLAATLNGIYSVNDNGAVRLAVDWRNVTALKIDNNNPSVMLAGSSSGFIKTYSNKSGLWKETSSSARDDISGQVSNFEQTADGNWWVLASGPAGLYRFNCTPADTTYILYDKNKGLTSDTLNHILSIDRKLYVCTGKGLYRYNPDTDLFEKDNDLIGDTFSKSQIYKILKSPEGDIYISGYDTRYFDALVTPTKQGHVVFRRQFDFLPNIETMDIEYIYDNIWIVKGRSLYVIDKGKLGYNYGSFNTFFTSITAGSDSLLMNGLFFSEAPTGVRLPLAGQPEGSKPSLRYAMNDISFRWATTSYVGEEKTEYRYKLEGFDRDWSKWEKRTFKDFTNLPHGSYIFRLKSKTITGLESKEATFSFTILKPWYATLAAIIIYILLAILLVLGIIRFYTRRLKNENIRLERLVKQRTAEVVRQKEELESSIHYASRIQRALLPSEKLLAEATSNYFILFKPRDIVSGDFYWISKKADRLFVVAADCTGHGVPGAFMSLLGISFLDEIINKLAFSKASMILNELRKQVIGSLKQIGETDEQKDGMDIALIVVDYSTSVVEFSGAYNPCFKVRSMTNEEIAMWENSEMALDEGSMANGKYILETVYGNKMPIGISMKMDQDFTQYEWKLEKDISYYMFTDGYIDQFNGVTGKKFMKKNFKKLILDIQDYPMSRQKEILEERLKSWMGSSPQIDDILVVGLKA